MSMAASSINQDAILNWAVAQISSMATGNCENCHTNPKFGTHRYCGKTCAAEAATTQRSAHPAKSKPSSKARVPLATQKPPCDYCGQKPKYDNYNYCSKSCASKAAAAQPGVQARPRPKQGVRPPATGAQSQPAKGSRPANRYPVAASPAKETSSEDDFDDYPDADEEDEEEDDTGPDTDLDAYPTDDDEPVPAAPTRPTRVAHASLKPSTPARRVPGTCLVPNCGKPSFVDRSGIKGDYCSTRHREEAVTLGLVHGCIMCQRYPQSGTDYFCSAACRNQSMMKP